MELALELFALALISLAAGTVHSGIGFGFAIVALAFLPFVIDPRDSHVMLTLCSVPMLTMNLWAYRRGIDWRLLRPAVIGVVLGLPLGVYLFKVLSLAWLVRATGFVILLMVVHSLLPKSQKATSASPLRCGIAAAIAAFLGGAVSIGGPPIATYGLRQDWPQEKFKAFLASCLLVMTVGRLVGLAVTGEINLSAAGWAAWVTPFALAGTYGGVRLSAKARVERFRLIVAVVLFGVACMLIYRGAPEQKSSAVQQPADQQLRDG